VLARAARRVCLAFPLAGREGERYRVTGRPGPPAREDRAGARERFGLAEGQRCVLVFGGSLGARSINLAAVEGFASRSSIGAAGATGASTVGASTGAASTSEASTDAAVHVHVLHVAGRRDYPELAARNLPAGYDLREYLDLDEFADALAAADLVVARAGGSVFEIAASGTPAILVPYPHASADHQAENARWMENAGAAVVIDDGELDGGRLAREVAALFADRERLGEMARAAKGLARPDAAKEIADELLEAART
jgi:UDP-N-acetylglucosamine--N-acetylmuramyl-(pentapeptide) pyrophosphoryl-undecaprenol N-acetylglucosamine transferase